MPTVRFIVSGRVQGVFYRVSARERARELDLAGHARNLPDGRVEVLASGSGEALDALEKWLWQGPPAADVVAASREDLPEQELHGFHIG